MKLTSVIMLTFSIFLAGCLKDNVNITHVMVKDIKHHIVQNVDDTRTLGELKKIWEDRTEIPQSKKPSFTFIVDVVTTVSSSRWLYDPNGYARIFGKANGAMYRFKDADRLREILIPQTGSRGFSLTVLTTPGMRSQ